MKRTPGRVEVGYPVEDDAVQEQGGRVDLHGAAEKTVEDPNVPGAQEPELTLNFFDYSPKAQRCHALLFMIISITSPFP